MYICINIYMYIYTPVYIYTYTYVHIYIYRCRCPQMRPSCCRCSQPLVTARVWPYTSFTRPRANSRKHTRARERVRERERERERKRERGRDTRERNRAGERGIEIEEERQRKRDRGIELSSTVAMEGRKSLRQPGERRRVLRVEGPDKLKPIAVIEVPFNIERCLQGPLQHGDEGGCLSAFAHAQMPIQIFAVGFQALHYLVDAFHRFAVLQSR